MHDTFVTIEINGGALRARSPVMGAAPKLRLFPDDPQPAEHKIGAQDSDLEHRILTPVLHPPGGEGARPTVAAFAAEFAERRCPDGYGVRATLRQFYDEWLAEDFARRVDEGSLAKNTAECYRRCLNRWSDFAPRPEGHVGRWDGLPLAAVSDRYVSEFCRAMAAERSPHYVRSMWGALRVLFNAAVKLGAIRRCPQPEAKAIGDGDPDVHVYTLAQLGQVYEALPDERFRAAWVLSNNVGCRTEDLFAMAGEQFDLDADVPSVTYVANKTGKKQTVPLAAVTVAHVRPLLTGRLMSAGKLFRGLTSFRNAEPERSRAARQRNATIKRIIAECGIEGVDKPWQMARKTCNCRLNDVTPGVGDFVLGHALTGVNARYYWRPTKIVVETVNALEQPREWVES